MSTLTMSLEARIAALEAALTASEQWNVCVCGHHGSSHDMRNRCMVCDCTHFGTRRPANTPTRELTDDLAGWLTYHKDDRDFLFDYLEACIDEDTDAQQRVVMRDMFDRLLEALKGQTDRILAAGDAARTEEGG